MEINKLRIIAGYPNAPKIDNRHIDKAFYQPSNDMIVVPKIGHFGTEQEYYSTLFHEMVHSTGHESRLKRDMSGGKKTKEYAFEELVAELGTTFLCGEAGILYYTLDNSAAYIKWWNERFVEIMKEDNFFIFKASAAAQKAANYILDVKENEDDEIEIPELITASFEVFSNNLSGYTETIENGVKIKIHTETTRHHLAHFHAVYNEYEASIDIDTLEIIIGTLPNNIYKKVKKWAESNQEFLTNKYNELNS